MLVTTRNRQLLRDTGRALVLAMDHGRVHGVIEGLEQPGAMLEAMVDSGVDGVLCNFGVAKRYRHLFANRVPLALRLDGGESLYRSDWLAYDEWRRLFTVDDAVQVGADAVVTMTFLGAAAELDSLEVTARTAVEADRAGLPLMVEALPCVSERVPDSLNPDAMADAARLAFEHGADLIKNYYTGDPDSYRKSIEATPLPTLIAGGERMSTTKEVFQSTYDAMQAGAAGAVVGRNIWQHEDPAGMARALLAIIHEGAAVGDALDIVEA